MYHSVCACETKSESKRQRRAPPQGLVTAIPSLSSSLLDLGQLSVCLMCYRLTVTMWNLASLFKKKLGFCHRVYKYA